jgi:hypothetical protein
MSDKDKKTISPPDKSRNKYCRHNEKLSVNECICVKKCSPGQESADLNKYKHFFPEHEVVLLFYQNLTFGPLAQKP